jgi:hypothetical protein
VTPLRRRATHFDTQNPANLGFAGCATAAQLRYHVIPTIRRGLASKVTVIASLRWILVFATGGLLLLGRLEHGTNYRRSLDGSAC